MFVVTDKARDEISKTLDSDQAKGKHLIVYFQGHG